MQFAGGNAHKYDQMIERAGATNACRHCLEAFTDANPCWNCAGTNTAGTLHVAGECKRCAGVFTEVKAMKTRPAGYIIDVPVTLSVHIRGKSWEEAQSIARAFAASLSPSEEHIKGYSDAIDGGITEAFLESSTEESCELLEELEAEPEVA